MKKKTISPPSPPVAVLDTAELEIAGLTHEGEGVGRIGGYTIFVPGALPGERVLARIVETKKRYGRAELLSVLSPSSSRIAPPCAVYGRCGGCQLQHMAYDAQLSWKRQLVVDALTRIGKLRVAGSDDRASFSEEGKADSGGDEVVVHPVIGMEEPWRYRNKAQVPIGFDLMEGGLIGGFYERGSHSIVDMDACLIQHERNDDAVQRVKRLARELGIEAYDRKSHTGWLRHVAVKVSFSSGEMLVVLVAASRDAEGLDRFVERIREELPHAAGILLNVNAERTSAVFGRETVRLWGRDVIFDAIGDVKFAISALSFYQVNPVQTERLYRKTLEYAALTGKETVIDAYSGIGTISLFLARAARKVYGVEVVKEAVKDARTNARLNDIENVEFVCGRAEDVLPAWRDRGVSADVIVVDPPRAGCDRRLLDAIIAMRPARVVYVSCNPATLARDLAVLKDGGFRTVEVQPVDMFPHTGHVEAVCSLIYKGF